MKIEDVIELADQLEKDDGPRNEAFLQDDKFYELNFKELLGLPNEHRQNTRILPTGRDMIDMYCNYTNVFNARVYTNTVVPGEKETDEARNERLYGQGVLYMTNLEAEISPWWQAAKHYWLHGMACMQTIWMADAWPDKPVRSKGESDEAYDAKLKKWVDDTGMKLPIKIRTVHPYNVHADYHYGELESVLEITRYPVIKASQRYKKFNKNKRDADLGDNVRHISYWDKEKHIELVDGQPVIKTRTGWHYHNYGFVPYVILNSGLGNLSYDNASEKKCVGLLRYVKDVLIEDSASFSINNIVLKKNSWPTVWLEGEDAQLAQIKEQFGGANILPPGVSIKEYQHLAPPDQLMMHWQVTHSLLEDHGATKSMQGQSEQGVRSGSHERIKYAQSATRLVHAIETFRSGTAKVLEYCACLLDVIPGDVTVMARTPIGVVSNKISKSKMKKPYNYSVIFSALNEEDDYRKHDDLIRGLAGGIYSLDYCLEQMPNVDKDKMREEMEGDRLLAMPALLDADNKALGIMYNNALMKRFGAEAVLASQPQPPEGNGQGGNGNNPMGPMVPDMSNRAIPGGPQDMQNRIRNTTADRRPGSPTQGQGGGGNRGAYR